MFEFAMTNEQKSLREEVREFVRSVDKQLLLDMDADKVLFPREFLEELGRRNLLGIRVPREWGGRSLGWQEDVITTEELGVLNSSLVCLYSVCNIVAEALSFFGTDAQKEKYLKPLLAGELVAAEALTEPRGGTDFFGSTTIARREGDYFVLNGQKRFIVGAEGADFFFVYAKTDPEAPPNESMTAFLVDRCEGVKTEYVYGLMGTRGGGAGRLVFKDVRVPVSNVVGEINHAKKVFYQMMIPERLYTAAGGIGVVRPGLDIATKYSTLRKAFGTHIKNFQAVNFMIAESVTKLDAARSLCYATALALDNNADPDLCRRMVSQSKKFNTEACWEAINNCMQVMGGIGYTNVYPIERMLRDTRLIMIWTGTNEIMNLIIQHEWYKQFKKEAEIRKTLLRDSEADAPEANSLDEKVFE